MPNGGTDQTAILHGIGGTDIVLPNGSILWHSADLSLIRAGSKSSMPLKAVKNALRFSHASGFRRAFFQPLQVTGLKPCIFVYSYGFVDGFSLLPRNSPSSLNFPAFKCYVTII